MKYILAILISLCTISLHSQTKVLVGGTLIDGFGGVPIQNSVIIIEGEKIIKVGHQGNTAIPQGAEVISTEGMSILPGL
ncbi:MAG: imidazolonepropionase-like amidohydrolase, partial [Saprospiraceae bacterium]